MLFPELLLLVLEVVVDLLGDLEPLAVKYEVRLGLALHSADILHLAPIALLGVADECVLVVTKLLELLLVGVDVGIIVGTVRICVKVGLDDENLDLLPVVLLAESLLDVPLSLFELLIFNDLSDLFEMIVDDSLYIAFPLQEELLVFFDLLWPDRAVPAVFLEGPAELVGLKRLLYWEDVWPGALVDPEEGVEVQELPVCSHVECSQVLHVELLQNVLTVATT